MNIFFIVLLALILITAAGLGFLGIVAVLKRKAAAAEDAPANRRRCARIPLKVSAELKTADGRQVLGETRDLSVMGAFLVAEERLPVGTEGALTLVITGGKGPIALTLTGKIVRHEDSGMGLKFTAMDRECHDNLKFVVHHLDSIEFEGASPR